MATPNTTRAETLSTPRQPYSVSRSGMGTSTPSRPSFPSEQLRPFLKNLLAKNLTGIKWDSSDKTKARAASKEISEVCFRPAGVEADEMSADAVLQRVKQKMIEIESRGFKYIVTVTMSENLGQAGRADMSCHWEESDTVVQEMWSNGKASSG